METKIGSLKGFLTATSFLEGATGLALMIMPSFVANLLLGSPLTDPIGDTISRVAGAALIAIGIACWFSRKSENVYGLIIALLFYNVATIVLLGYAGLFNNLNGNALWPAVIVHVVLAAWSAKCLSFTTRVKS